MSGSRTSPVRERSSSAIAWRNSVTPAPGGYWLWPSRIARAAASIIDAGPSVSGKPWPRLIASCLVASCDTSAKMVVECGASLRTVMGAA